MIEDNTGGYMQTDESKPIANQGIVLREESDDWAVLFDPDTSDVYGLNPISMYIWKCLDGKNTIADIVLKLGKECIDMPDDAMDQVKKFVDELVAKGYAGYKA
ncbi:MAG: SynChlorMet cassette protein ScmD [Syntrophobacteraceae bacterium]|jgi:SynChlorMet cassette protein ScmD